MLGLQIAQLFGEVRIGLFGPRQFGLGGTHDPAEFGADGGAPGGQRLLVGDPLGMAPAEGRRQHGLLLRKVRIGLAQPRQRLGGQLFGSVPLHHVVDVGPLHLIGLDAQRGDVGAAARQLVVDAGDVIVVDQLAADADELVLRLVVLDRTLGVGDGLAQFRQASGQGIARLARRRRLHLAHLVDEGGGDETRQAGRFLRVLGGDIDVDHEALRIAVDEQFLAEVLQGPQPGLARGDVRIAEIGDQVGDEGEGRGRLAVELGVLGEIGGLDDLVQQPVRIDDGDLALDQGKRRLARQAVRGSPRSGRP